MADYREISQQYAQGGIKAAILLNGGAAVALLSQVSDLIDAKLSDEVWWSMVCWSVGTFLGACTWIVAFYSTRLVDRFERAEVRTLQPSNVFMQLGLLALAFSLICFLIGCLSLAFALRS
jgi:hypothetical protein